MSDYPGDTTGQFQKVFGGHGVGGICMECVCGRTHFVDDPTAGDWEPDELQSLRQAAKKKDGKTIAHHDGVSAADINGNPIVWGCPCEWMERFERMIWNERERVLEYLALRWRTELAVLNRCALQIDAAEKAKATADGFDKRKR